MEFLGCKFLQPLFCMMKSLFLGFQNLELTYELFSTMKAKVGGGLKYSVINFSCCWKLWEWNFHRKSSQQAQLEELTWKIVEVSLLIRISHFFFLATWIKMCNELDNYLKPISASNLLFWFFDLLLTILFRNISNLIKARLFQKTNSPRESFMIVNIMGKKWLTRTSVAGDEGGDVERTVALNRTKPVAWSLCATSSVVCDGVTQYPRILNQIDEYDDLPRPLTALRLIVFIIRRRESSGNCFFFHSSFVALPYYYKRTRRPRSVHHCCVHTHDFIGTYDTAAGACRRR